VSGRRAGFDILVRCLRGEPVAQADWMQVLERANADLLAPALWSALRASGEASSLPKDARDYLAMLHRLNAARNKALRAQALEFVGALNERGIVPILLKGGLALFDGPYADPAARMMRDLDVMVPARERDDAIAVLKRLGYRLTRCYGAAHHAFGDFARASDPGSVDLHTELLDPFYVLPACEVWDRAQPRQAGGVRFLALAPTDRLLHNLLHAQVHHFGKFYRGEIALQQVHEFVALARFFGAAIDWVFVERRMRSHRLSTVLHSYLLAAQRWLALEWPLSEMPSAAARLHCLRCELQLNACTLRWAGILWGNLSGPFAWHRMHALHGDRGGPLGWRCRHLLQYLRKKGVSAVVERLLRFQ
jgi:hypothetical protein